MAINTDAHHSDHYGFRHYGVANAQRGWATKNAIVNTWPADELLAYIA
jgi:DNA polymerase (family 10)